MSSEIKQETRHDMIACENVDKWFGDFQALKGVTATIAEQEVVVVLGLGVRKIYLDSLHQ